jgi:transposase
MEHAYDETTLELLRLTIPGYGILVPILQRAGTNEIIDGRHRLKVREELEQQGIRIMLPVHHITTEDPEEIDRIVNSVRRPWQDTEQRRELVAKLREKNHSQRAIAKVLRVHHTTVLNDIKAQPPGGGFSPPGDSVPTTSKGKDGKTYKPPATPAEVSKAWEMKDSGMSAPAIAKDLGRGDETVRNWFKKPRPEASVRRLVKRAAGGDAIGVPVVATAPWPCPRPPADPLQRLAWGAVAELLSRQ